MTEACPVVLAQASGEHEPVLVTAAARLDQRARRQERRAASARGFARRRRIDALSAAAGAIAMVCSCVLLYFQACHCAASVKRLRQLSRRQACILLSGKQSL